jgi:hypothetical protein
MSTIITSKAVNAPFINVKFTGMCLAISAAISFAWENNGIWMMPFLKPCCPNGLGVPMNGVPGGANRPYGSWIISGSK